MTPATTTRTTSDGLTLTTRHWPVPDPRATVLIVHGLAEHGGRYDHVARILNEHGFAVRATDLRGFGDSGGARAYVDDFSQYVDDLATDVEEARSEGAPVVVLGHSMGGLIAALYAESDHRQPNLLVLSAPAIDARIPKAKEILAKVLVRVAPKLMISNGLKGDQLSRDPSVGERYFADPLVIPRSTVRLGVELMAAMDRARAGLDAITLPTLVIHAAEDPIVPVDVSAPLSDRPNVTRVVFDDFRHESFNEEGGRLATQTVADWIDAQL